MYDRPSRALIRSIALITILSIALMGCDRPFRDVEPPSIEVLEPDLTEVQLNSTIILRVSTESFRLVDRLEIDSQPVTRDPQSGFWLDTLTLDPGVNTFVLKAFDVDGAVRVDTVHAVHVRMGDAFRSAALPSPRGGHTATLMRDGRVLIAGGAASPTGAGRSDAYLLFPPSSVLVTDNMRSGRVGHTASLLPDGRVLILGGSREAEIDELADLIDDVEIFDPTTNQFFPVPLVGDPLLRAYHTAMVYDVQDAVEIDVYGGRGDVSFGGGGRLGTRRDVRTYRFQGDTLYSVGSATGGTLLEPLSGHTQTPVESEGSRSEEISLIVGASFAGGDFETVSLLLNHRTPGQFPTVRDGPPVLYPRAHHAAIKLVEGMVLVLGGRQGDEGLLVGNAELYIHNLSRYFSFPAGILGPRLFGLSATKLADGRILVTGGFNQGMEALSEVGVYSMQL